MAMEPETRDPRRAAEAAVTDGVLSLSRAFRKAKARLEAAGGPESAIWQLLLVVGAAGPMRASALATCVHSDLSTVSRQSGQLVTDGLLRRQADPADGRASLLALTPAGEQVRAEHIRIRNDFFADVLQGWTNDELAQFAGFLGRFAADHERTHAAHLDGAER